MPIGGQSAIEDVAPEPLRLGQVDVDEGIARILAVEEQEMLERDRDPKANALPGIPPNGIPPSSILDTEAGTDIVNETASANLSGIQNTSNVERPTGGQAATTTETVADDVHKGACPKVYSDVSKEVVTKKGSHGAFKNQLYGLRRPAPKDRSYRCKICGTTKRSMEDLNDHHR